MVHIDKLIEKDHPALTRWAKHGAFYRKEDGVQVCGAPKKVARGGPDERCGHTDLLPNQRCKFHGSGGPPMKNGRYSQRLKRIKIAYEAALNAEDIDDLDPTLALIDVRIGELAEALEEQKETSAEFLAAGMKKVEKAIGASRMGLPVEGDLKDLREHFEKGASRSQHWNELIDLCQTRSKRTEAKISLMQKGNTIATHKDLVILMTKILNIVLDVRDTKIRDSLVRRLDNECMGGGIGLGSLQAGPESDGPVLELPGTPE
jgi:hypothetical protein